MIHRSPLPPRAELEAMIGRAEAACSRYRGAAVGRGLSPAVIRNRRRKLETMEKTLARLREQGRRREPSTSPA